jgi:hypothetical protein
MPLPGFNLEITKDSTRDNFQLLSEFFSKETPFLGFRVIEMTLTENQTNYKYPHNLGFQPKDVIVTSKKGSGTVSFNYDKFDATNLNMDVSGIPSVSMQPSGLVMRILVGTLFSGVK